MTIKKIIYLLKKFVYKNIARFILKFTAGKIWIETLSLTNILKFINFIQSQTIKR